MGMLNLHNSIMVKAENDWILHHLHFFSLHRRLFPFASKCCLHENTELKWRKRFFFSSFALSAEVHSRYSRRIENIKHLLSFLAFLFPFFHAEEMFSKRAFFLRMYIYATLRYHFYRVMPGPLLHSIFYITHRHSRSSLSLLNVFTINDSYAADSKQEESRNEKARIFFSVRYSSKLENWPVWEEITLL